MQLEKLNTKFIGRNLIYYKTVESTQVEAWRLIQSGKAKNGTIIIADLQTKGKRNSWKKMVYRSK